jgi:hypothetical protein
LLCASCFGSSNNHLLRKKLLTKEPWNDGILFQAKNHGLLLEQLIDKDIAESFLFGRSQEDHKLDQFDKGCILGVFLF